MSELFNVAGEAYDDFMGRYSTRLAPLFADFAGVGPGQRVLDVGAGTGALTAELLGRGASVAAADPSASFVAVLRERFPEIEVQETGAEQLPFEDDSFDVAVAQLVVAFMSDAPAAIAEMARVARRVAVCMWGVAEVEMFAAIDAASIAMGSDYGVRERNYRTPQELHDLLAPHGAVEAAELDVTAGYRGYDEFWNALGERVGPAGQWLSTLDDGGRARAREEVFRRLGSPSGSFELRARAFAAATTRG